MESNKKKSIESFFDLSIDKQARCLEIDCKSKLQTQKPSALIRHFTQKHPSKLKDVTYSREKNLAWLRLSTIYTCVKHVTICGRPLISINDESFQEFLQERLKKLEGTPHALTINVQVVKGYVNECAKKLRDRIKKEIEDKVVSLMLDVATRLNRSILGISLQTILNGEIIVRTIGMERIRVRHTAINIKTMVTGTMDQYTIKNRDVLSITHDNGANLIAFTEQMDAFLAADEDDEDLLDRDLFLDPEIQADLLQRAAEEMNSSFKPMNFTHTNSIRCGSHTFQLSVNCVMDGPECATVMKNALELVKELRKPRFRHQLENSNVPVPRLENKTRWFSKFMMVN